MGKEIKSIDVHALALLLACLIVASIILSNSLGVWRILAVFIFSLAVWSIYKKADLKARDLGVSRQTIGGGLTWGLGAMVVIGLVIFVASAAQPDLFMDARYRQSLGQAILEGIFYVPFATILFEEVAFRGVLLALLQRHYSNTKAIILSSLCFGLWHVISAAGIRITLFASAGVWGDIVSVLLVVVATGIAGAFFCLLRIKSGSLLAPIIAHWSINAFALFAAAIAWNV